MGRFVVVATLLLVAAVASVEGRGLGRLFGRPATGTGTPAAGGDECQRVCGTLKFKTLCLRLTKQPGVTTPRALLDAAAQEAIGKAKAAKSMFDSYAVSSGAVNPMLSILQTCSGAYDSVAQSLEDTRRISNTGGSASDLMTAASGGTTSAGDCDDAFDERPEISSPFVATQRNVFRLADNVLGIAKFVTDAHH